jgi:hypothetical protein
VNVNRKQGKKVIRQTKGVVMGHYVTYRPAEERDFINRDTGTVAGKVRYDPVVQPGLYVSVEGKHIPLNVRPLEERFSTEPSRTDQKKVLTKCSKEYPFGSEIELEGISIPENSNWTDYRLVGLSKKE